MQNATDKQASQDLLDSNPGMLWRRALTKKDNFEFAARFSKDSGEYEVLHICLDGLVISIWSEAKFESTFHLSEFISPKMSSDLDQKLFSLQINNQLKTVRG